MSRLCHDIRRKNRLKKFDLLARQGAPRSGLLLSIGSRVVAPRRRGGPLGSDDSGGGGGGFLGGRGVSDGGLGVVVAVVVVVVSQGSVVAVAVRMFFQSGSGSDGAGVHCSQGSGFVGGGGGGGHYPGSDGGAPRGAAVRVHHDFIRRESSLTAT